MQCNFFLKGEGGGGFKERGLNTFLLLKRSGLLERGGLTEDLQYAYIEKVFSRVNMVSKTFFDNFFFFYLLVGI